MNNTSDEHYISRGHSSSALRLRRGAAGILGLAAAPSTLHAKPGDKGMMPTLAGHA